LASKLCNNGYSVRSLTLAVMQLAFEPFTMKWKAFGGGTETQWPP